MFLVRYIPHSAVKAEAPFSFVTDTAENAKRVVQEKVAENLVFKPSIIGHSDTYIKEGIEYRDSIFDTTGQNWSARTEKHGQVWIAPIDYIQ